MALSLCACGGADEDETEPAPTEPIAGIVSVTLRDGSCTLDGPRTVSDGHLIVELLRDDDEQEGSFELLRLADGITFEALEEHVEREEDRLESGRQTLGYEAFASLEASAELIEPDRQAVLDPQPQDLEPGEHAVLCIQLPKLDVVGPLTVVP
jgi:hypothetical protein